MSLTLAATDTITGVAGSATSITYTIFGDEIAAGADAFKVLAQGQLPSTVGTLYTVPASTATIVKAIHLVNGTGGAVTARLNIKGTAAANAILPAISILAGGFAIFGDDGWRVYNDQGQILGVGATGATGPGDIATDTIWTAAGDLAVATGADVATVLPVGDEDDVLTVVSGVPAWAPPAGGGGAITVEDEGTPLSTGADTLDFVGDGVTASGTGTTKTITIPGAGVTEIVDLPTAEMDDSLVLAPDGAGGVEFRAEAGGAGGSPFYLDTLALHGTYGDAFAAATLDGKWNLQGFGANSKLVPEANLGLRMSMMPPAASARSIWQAFTNKDEAEIIAAFTMDYYAADAFFGPYIVGSTGTGVGAGVRPNSGLFVWTSLVSYYCNGLGTARSLRLSNWDIGGLIWISLYKRSADYQLRFSLDGTHWTIPYIYTPSAFTPAKIGFGRLYAGAFSTEELIFLRRFNVINDLNLGNNLVRTPTAGAPTYSASSEYSGSYTAAKAADGDTGTAWAAANGNTDNPCYWRCAWSDGQTLNRVRLYSRGSNSLLYDGHLDLYDGATHTYVPFPNQLYADGVVYVDFPTLTGITQLNVVAGSASDNNAGLKEVEAYLAS